VTIDKTNMRMGLGAIVRNHKGDVIAEKSLTKLGNLKPVAAEALGALHVTEFSRDLDLRKIILKGNALPIVNAVKSSKRNWSRYEQLADDARGVLNRLHE
jgi:hypothetical protein